MAIEPLYAWAFLYSVLSADAIITGVGGLGSAKIYLGAAPQGTPHPFIVASLQAGDDLNNLNQQSRLISDQVWLVKAVGRVQGGVLQDAARYRAVVNRMDELLRNKRRVSHTVEGVTFFYNTWRRRPVFEEPPGETADIRYRHAGGEYPVQVFA